jgi:hypothetical protein
MYKLPLSDSAEADAVLDDCIRKLKQRRLQEEQQAIAAQIAELQIQDAPSNDSPDNGTNSPDRLERLVQRNIEIADELHRRERMDGTVPSGVE